MVQMIAKNAGVLCFQIVKRRCINTDSSFMILRIQRPSFCIVKKMIFSQTTRNKYTFVVTKR